MRLKFDDCGAIQRNTFDLGDVAACPLCGRHEGLRITGPERYERLVNENGASLIEIGCNDCHLSLQLFKIPENNYEYGLGILMQKWNHRA